MTLSRSRAALLAVFALAAFLRFYRLDLPFVEPYNSLSRQAICATVAKNFYKHGFDFFHPEIDENGAGPYLYNAEMPFYTYLMALGYGLAGGVKEWVARLVSVLFSLGTIAMLMDLVRRTQGARAACGAGLFLALSPLYLAVSRSVQPEACMFFATVGAVWAFWLYREKGEGRWLIATAAFLFLAVATKIYNLYILIPIMYLAWKKDGWAFLRKGRYWLALAFAVLPLLWYFAMWKAGRTEKLIYDPYDFVATRGPAGKSYLELLGPKYLWFNGRILLVHLLTPLGALFAAISIFAKRPISARVFAAWLLSVVALMLVMWRTVLDHSYYQLPFAPVLAFYVGCGAVFLWDRANEKKLAAVLIGVSIVAGAVQAGVYSKLYRGIYFVPAASLRMVEAGKVVREATPPNSLVIASQGTGTTLLYYCDRKGWSFYAARPEEALIEELETRKKEGAGYFVSASASELKVAPGFERALRAHPVLYDQDDVLLVELQPNPSSKAFVKTS
jgi:4-amino-4-deoxy-L-arabinose transferase-like glycosyltransferase